MFMETRKGDSNSNKNQIKDQGRYFLDLHRQNQKISALVFVVFLFCMALHEPKCLMENGIWMVVPTFICYLCTNINFHKFCYIFLMLVYHRFNLVRKNKDEFCRAETLQHLKIISEWLLYFLPK